MCMSHRESANELVALTRSITGSLSCSTSILLTRSNDENRVLGGFFANYFAHKITMGSRRHFYSARLRSLSASLLNFTWHCRSSWIGNQYALVPRYSYWALWSVPFLSLLSPNKDIIPITISPNPFKLLSLTSKYHWTSGQSVFWTQILCRFKQAPVTPLIWVKAVSWTSQFPPIKVRSQS